MSLKINYDPTNNVLLATSLLIDDVTEGVSVDALRVIFQSLFEAGERVDVKISNNQITPEGDGQPYISYSSIMGDIWIIIDNIRRLELVLQHVQNIPGQLLIKLRKVFISIKDIRDSFQHIDERISKHFTQFGASVYGELFYRHRTQIGLSESYNCLVSGINRKPRHTQGPSGPEAEEFINRTGYYDYIIMYIKRDSRRSDAHTTVIVNLEEAIDTVNELIDYLETTYSRQYESSETNEVFKGGFPYHVAIWVKQEALDA